MRLPIDKFLPIDNALAMGKSRVSAAERLRVRLEEADWDRKRFCEEIGVSPPVVSRWLSGERTPSLEMACRIEQKLGIPVEAWRPLAKAS